MALQVGYRFPQRAIGLDQAVVDLLVEPGVEPLHERAPTDGSDVPSTHSTLRSSELNRAGNPTGRT